MRPKKAIKVFVPVTVGVIFLCDSEEEGLDLAKAWCERNKDGFNAVETPPDDDECDLRLWPKEDFTPTLEDCRVYDVPAKDEDADTEGDDTWEAN